MIDTAVADRLFELARELGVPPLGFAVFDKRVLLPLDQLAEMVTTESTAGADSLAVPVETTQRYAEAGLFPLLPRDGVADDLGFPLYVPSRIKALFALESQGWTMAELHRVAESEEMTIDWILAADDLAYEDDDVALVVRNLEEERRRDEDLLAYIEAGPRASDPPPRHEPGATAASVAARLASTGRRIELLRSGSLSAATLESVARVAYRIRVRDEGIRLFMFEKDRAVLKAGVSPWIAFCKTSWTPERPFSFEGISWASTVRQPAVGEDDEPLPVRLPGVVLRDGEVTLTSVATPHEYGRIWREYALDDYFRERAEARSERVCHHCLKALAPMAKATRLYCSATCRQAAKMQRFRQNSPLKHMAIQERYWTE